MRYIPTEADYFGSDSFTYTIQDNGQSGDPLVNDFKSDTGTVNVTVTPVNDPPKANDGPASVAEDSATGVLVDVKANDSTGPANESGQTLTITGVTQGAHGSVAIVLGQDPVHAHRRRLLRLRLLHLHDPGQRSERRPAGQRLQERHRHGQRHRHPGQRPAERQQRHRLGGRGQRERRPDRRQGQRPAGPANESGQTLTITGVTQGAHGSVAIEAGKVRYTPTEADYFGPDSFTYTIQDNGQSGDPLVNDFKSDTGTVNVTVTEVNDPPVAATDTASVAEDSASGVLSTSAPTTPRVRRTRARRR